MLTKEGCENALTNILCNIGVARSDYKTSGKAREDYHTLKSLIEEHFDNQPLKFEELKECMLVWDNKHHTYIKIDRIWESYNKAIYFYAIGWECCENTEFEPNRFYRKEIKDVD